jgi:hypothetical protein
MTPQDLQNWATAYIEAQNSDERIHENHRLWWPIGRFFELELEHPEDCWAGILAVLWREPSEKVLGVLAAGPLEDLIQNHGEHFIERIEAEAKTDPAFRALLHGVWESGTPEVWARIQKARGPKRRAV